MTPLETMLELGAVLVNEATLETFVGSHGPSVLVFTGDATQRPEAQDIAVIARELVRQVPTLRVGVVSSDSEPGLKNRFAITAVPTILFLEDGRTRSSVIRLQPWASYRNAARLAFGPQEASHG